jgi:hypothetical protein
MHWTFATSQISALASIASQLDWQLACPLAYLPAGLPTCRPLACLPAARWLDYLPASQLACRPAARRAAPGARKTPAPEPPKLSGRGGHKRLRCLFAPAGAPRGGGITPPAHRAVAKPCGKRHSQLLISPRLAAFGHYARPALLPCGGGRPLSMAFSGLPRASAAWQAPSYTHRAICGGCLSIQSGGGHISLRPVETLRACG